ncbi:DUF3006 family protein [Lacticigenium naphthae]|uniref:DUF3006 family protein n=1 Tax=Lacticigenium naphthae TaxID=515351 RepID=UPI000428744A|nr:DUF3006 family protein [Lacticigenium naphthae]
MKMIIEEIEGEKATLIGDEVSEVIVLPVSLLPENYELKDIVEITLDESEIEKSQIVLLKNETQKRKKVFQQKREKLLNRKKTD